MLVAIVGLALTPTVAAAELLAVLELSGALPADPRQALTDAVRQEATNATRAAGIKVMTQENMETMLTDMGQDASCISEGACEVDTLRNLQANYGVTGKITDFGGTYVVTLQLYEMRGGTLMGSERVNSADALELLDPLVPDATPMLMGLLPGGGAPMGSRLGTGTVPAPSGLTPEEQNAAQIREAVDRARSSATAAPQEASETPPDAYVAPPADWEPPVMSRVPAGTYQVGHDETVQTVVLTSAYEVMEHEVTQGEYEALMGENPSHFSSCGSECPVERVSWLDAVEYANAVSRAAGVEECYAVGAAEFWPKRTSCSGYRLPTEAEWEVAARGGTTTLYSGGSKVKAVAWTTKNSRSSTHPVKQLSPNAYGLYDMSGNVSEWTWNWFGESVGSDVQTDPHGPVSGSKRVHRGGAWNTHPLNAFVAHGGWPQAPSIRAHSIGFRLVKTVESPSR